jgi:L-alanine-DL-glutamate epimerase-like enolase superfamily enzyme
MKIAAVETWKVSVPLRRPYAIAFRTISHVDLFFIRLTAADGRVGLGSASPAEEVTDETAELCSEALDSRKLEWLEGQDVRHLAALCRRMRQPFYDTPAARVGVEMALYDLFAKRLDLPLVDLLGRAHDNLLTSVTIGIKPSVEEALAEASEHVGRGFRCLKVKVGRSFEQEVELLKRMRESVGPRIQIRVDANRGYSVREAEQFWPVAQELNLELVEQPVRVRSFSEIRSLSPEYRQRVAADESLLDEEDALSLLQVPAACGIFNIKLMKCGGISSALTIAGFAETADVKLMWGCMDESVISISAALHAAYACPNTRFLDLDGSFDLPNDPARGGFVLDDGRLRLLDKPGLGVELIS